VKLASDGLLTSHRTLRLSKATFTRYTYRIRVKQLPGSRPGVLWADYLTVSSLRALAEQIS
jgi:hypothetical protein